MTSQRTSRRLDHFRIELRAHTEGTQMNTILGYKPLISKLLFSHDLLFSILQKFVMYFRYAHGWIFSYFCVDGTFNQNETLSFAK